MAGVDFARKFSYATRTMRPSGVGELLKNSNVPGVTSLAAGAPDPDLFPVKEFKKYTNKAFKDFGPGILQYGPPEGFEPLRQALPEFLVKDICEPITKPENIIITAGSQEGLLILAQVFLSRGCKVAVDKPTYIGAKEAFDMFSPEYIEIESDEHGADPKSLRKAFKDHPDIRFYYALPNFQNPTGKTMPLDRRIEMAQIAGEYGQLIVEDDPYGRLRLEGNHIRPIQSFASENTIGLFTFSKMLAPGIRVGGMTLPNQMEPNAKKRIMNKAAEIKGRGTLTTAPFNQAVITEFIENNVFKNHIPRIIEENRLRRNAMAEIIEEFFPKVLQFTSPNGGMFLWGELKDEYKHLAPKLNMHNIMDELVEQHKVDFTDGRFFYAYPKKTKPSMRLNFARWPVKKMEPAMKIIGEVLTQKLS